MRPIVAPDDEAKGLHEATFTSRSQISTKEDPMIRALAITTMAFVSIGSLVLVLIDIVSR